MAKKKEAQVISIIESAKAVLEKWGNPTVTFVPIPDREEDREDFYVPFGVNICTPNDDVVWPTYDPAELTSRVVFITRQRVRVDYTIAGTPRTFAGLIAQYAFEGDLQNIHVITADDIKIHIEGTTDRQAIAGNRLPIAFVYENIIFPCWRWEEKNPEHEQLFNLVLERAFAHIPEAKFPRKKPENFEAIQFGKAVTKFYNERARYLAEEIEGTKNEAASYLERYLDRERRVQAILIEQEALKNSALNIAEENRRIAEAFTKNTKCKSWAIKGNTLVFELHNLHLTYKKETLDLPPIKVSINLTTGKFTPSMPSAPEVIPMHPHVFPHGEPCLGNFSTLFRKILTTGRFNQILDLLIQFFESYNPDSPVPDGGRWQFYRAILRARNRNIDFEKADHEWNDYLRSLES